MIPLFLFHNRCYAPPSIHFLYSRIGVMHHRLPIFGIRIREETEPSLFPILEKASYTTTSCFLCPNLQSDPTISYPYSGIGVMHHRLPIFSILEMVLCTAVSQPIFRVRARKLTEEHLFSILGQVSCTIVYPFFVSKFAKRPSNLFALFRNRHRGQPCTYFMLPSSQSVDSPSLLFSLLRYRRHAPLSTHFSRLNTQKDQTIPFLYSKIGI